MTAYKNAYADTFMGMNLVFHHQGPLAGIEPTNFLPNETPRIIDEQNNNPTQR
jgi:hypothetical protein